MTAPDSLLALLQGLDEDERELAQSQEPDTAPIQTPASEVEDAGEEDGGEDEEEEDGGLDAEMDADIDAEIDAELDDDDDEDDDDEEEEEEEDPEGTADEYEGPEEAEDGPYTAQTPGPASIAPTPGAPTPAEQHVSDDDKIGEEDIEDYDDDDVDDDDDMNTPAAPSGTPASVLAVPVHDANDRPSVGGTGPGGELPAEMVTKKQDTEKDIEHRMTQRQADESKLVVHFDKHQMERYEHFKRSRINKVQMKKLVDVVAGKAVTNPNVVIALCGVTKMFVGELVETARLVATAGNYYGPLMPIHVYEAYRMLQTDKKSIVRPKRARLFR